MINVARRFILAAAVLGLMAGVTGRAGASVVQLITNGDFEAGGGSFAGWNVADQAGGSGSWFIQSGSVSPLISLPVPTPPGPTHAAMTGQFSAGSHVLYQDFFVPIGVTAATLNFDRFIQNSAGGFATPNSLDYTGGPNQQARVDIITTMANPFSVATGDVLLNLFRTRSGDPLVSGYTTQTDDLTSFLAGRGGQTLRLRFAEVDNQLYFNFGVDRVGLVVTTGTTAVPEASTLAMTGLVALAGMGYGWRRRRAG